MGRLTFSFIDMSGETGSVGLPIPDLGPLNVETYTDGGTAYTTLENAINALTLLNPTGSTVTAEVVSVAAVRPSNPNAQRETGLLVLAADAGGHKTRFVLPGLDRSIVAQDGTDEVPLTGVTEVENLITAVETHLVDPITGNALTVYGVRMVGRNN